jgi:hypothetical protein
MAGTAAFFHGSMQDPALAHGLMAFDAVLVLSGQSLSREQKNDGRTEGSRK